MESVIGVLLLVLLVRWVVISRRLKKISQRIDQLSSGAREQSGEAIIQELVERVKHLEMVVQRGYATPPGPREAAAPEAVRPSAVHPEGPSPGPILVQGAPPGGEAVRRAARFAVPKRTGSLPIPSAPMPTEPSLFARWSQRIREHMAGEEWEAVVGGSWLNKLGVLVLVIGVALFLGYSLTHLGPAGRVAIGFVVSGAMLAGGVILERRVLYVIFARGLIGGGWAALYFTTYAMHALEAARVIQEPLVGMVLLGAVAAGMILHSLRYRSEVTTGLAYFVGFVTVAISPVSSFSVVASVPLVGSLLFVAQRLSWVAMVVAGVVGTYGTYALRYGVGSSEGSFPVEFISGQVVLFIYWVLFEGFDLFDVRKRRQGLGLARTIFPLNACGFVGASLLQWSSVTPTTLPIFFAAAAVAYLVSTNVRARVRPSSSFPEGTGTLTRALSGGYEAAVTVAVALVMPGIFLRFSGLTLNVALLFEAEFLFLAGLRLGQPYLRALGALVFFLPVIKLGLDDVLRGGQMVTLGMNVMAWTPVALLMAAVFYLNRGLIWPERESLLLFPEVGYSYTASALLALILGFEVPREYLGLGWLVLALPLFELGLWKRLREFRFQSYGVATLSLGTFLVVNVFGAGGETARLPWISLGPAVVLAYAASARLLRLLPNRLPAWERLGARDVSSAAGTVLLAALLWHVLPTPVVAVGWGVLSLLLIEIGFALPLPILRLQGNLVGALAFGRLFLANFTGTGETAGISHRILTVLPLILLFYYLWTRLRVEGEQGRLVSWERRVAGLYLYAPALLAVLLIRFEVGRVLAVVGWALFGLGLLFFGIRWRNPHLRWQSYALALLTFVRSWVTNFYIPESLAGVSGRIVTGAVVIGSFYAAQFLSPRRQEDAGSVGGNWFTRWLTQFDLKARTIFSVLATALLTVLLFYEVSGSLLTVAWGLEGVALLGAGFPLRERILRLSGLLLLGVCILKVFVYDLRELEALPRIVSFVVLGLVLLGVSLIYTRFREQLRRYL